MEMIVVEVPLQAFLLQLFYSSALWPLYILQPWYFETVNQKQQRRRSVLCIHTPSVWFSLQLHSNSDKGDGSVRYILSGEGAGTIFIIDEVTGDIHATKSLDRERKTHYVLHAQALDRNTEEALEPKSEFIIKVQDINDNAPKFPDGPFVATVPEMSEVGE